LGGTTGAFLVFAGLALTAAILFLLMRRHTGFARRGLVTPPTMEPIGAGAAST
jgi:hypothetical protein